MAPGQLSHSIRDPIASNSTDDSGDSALNALNARTFEIADTA